MATDLNSIADKLSDRFGLAVRVLSDYTDEGLEFVIIPIGIEHTIAFKIKVVLGWRRLSAVFVPGDYAANLVSQMQKADTEKKVLFCIFASDLAEKGALLEMTVNSRKVNPINPNDWPEEWKTLSLAMQKPQLVIEDHSQYNLNEALPWLYGFYGLCLSLLPIEQVDEQEINGIIEGELLWRRARGYERSKINRAACIQIHGSSCLICGFDFYEHYGDLGSGFIHVHHVIPLSEIKEEYICNPAKDLIPVCPNCHAMLHRKQPALTPTELIRLVNDHGRFDS
jgi:5-methylcytosine-specific restriction protein A